MEKNSVKLIQLKNLTWKHQINQKAIKLNKANAMLSKLKPILSRSYIKRCVWYNLYHSQSVFKFSLRLLCHTSCSYRLHKSCSYRVFSLQEFKQNDSRTSCSGNNYCTNFREKQVKEKEKTWEKSVWNLGLKEEKTYNFMKLCLQNCG